MDKGLAGTMAERAGSATVIMVEEVGRLISEPLLLIWQLVWLLREEAAVVATILVLEAPVVA